MKKYAEKFYKSRQWQATRDAYAQSKSYLCEECLKSGTITAGEIVHHKRPITRDNINNPDITLNWDNLQLLCRAHHDKAHHVRPAKRYTVDELGRVTILPDAPETQTGGAN